MKQVIGATILLLGAALVGLLGLRIWGVAPLSTPTLWRSGATLLLLAGALAALVVVRFAFFNNPAAGYDARLGRRAHPRSGPAPRLPE